MSATLSKKKKAAFSLLTLALIFSVLNLIAGLCERRQVLLQTTEAAISVEDPYWEVQPGQKLPVTLKKNYDDGKIKINSKGYRGAEFEAAKPLGSFRVVCIGDSCTFGRKHTYPEALASLLNGGNKEAPVDRYGKQVDLFEVINGGIEGAKSAWALERMREALEYEPDLFI